MSTDEKITLSKKDYEDLIKEAFDKGKASSTPPEADPNDINKAKEWSKKSLGELLGVTKEDEGNGA